MLASKYPNAAFRLTLPDLLPSPLEEGPPGKFFVHAVDDERALIGGERPLALIDAPTGETLAVARRPDGSVVQSWHFDVSNAGDQLAVIDYESFAIRYFTVPDLNPLGSHTPTGIAHANEVVFGPDDTRLYVLGWDRLTDVTGVVVFRTMFLAIDTQSGTVLHSVPLMGVCSGFCVANPVAVSRDGGVAGMERTTVHARTTLMVDTETDLPIAEVEGGMSIAADPTRDRTFYLLDVAGRVRRVRIDP